MMQKAATDADEYISSIHCDDDDGGSAASIALANADSASVSLVRLHWKDGGGEGGTDNAASSWGDGR